MCAAHAKPRVAIPIPTSADQAYNERCWPEFAAAVEAVGGEPIRFLLTNSPDDTARLLSGCSAILLPGSPADVQPQKYGQERQPETAAPDPAREAIDELLLQDAFHVRKPILGICFGMQMMNVWRGGSLTQHLEKGHAPDSDQKPLQHTLDVQPEAMLLRSIYLDADSPAVNSSHHQAVDRPGDGLLVAARASQDGVVEALESATANEHFVMGVQWHPERSYTEDEPSLNLFTAFVAAAHRWRLPNA